MLKWTLFLFAYVTINSCIILSVSEAISSDLSDSISELSIKAEAGNAQAQYQLAAELYNCGECEPEDYDKAIEWGTKAAEQDHVDAQSFLGTMYSEGIPKYHASGMLLSRTKVNREEALKWLTMAAERGHKIAQNNLGTLYLEVKDEEQAIKWYTKAAEQGLVNAMGNLALFYDLRLNRREGDAFDNHREAHKWYTQFAEHGGASVPAVRFLNDPNLLLRVALESSEGRREEVGLEAVRKLTDQKMLEKVALEAKSHRVREAAISKVNDRDLLKKVQMEGSSSARWRIKELDELAKAQAGDAEIQLRLGIEAYKWNRTNEARKWWTKAAQQGHVEAQYRLGSGRYSLDGGFGYPNLFWLNKAAEQGHVEAQYELGRHYDDELSVGRDRDFVQAQKWYTIAASNGRELERREIERFLVDQDVLIRIAKHSKKHINSETAVKKIIDPKVLRDMSLESPHLGIRIAAIETLSALKPYSLTDATVLADLASADPAAQIRLVAVQQITNDNFLFERSYKDSSAEVRFQAADQIQSQDLLVKIATDSYHHELRELAKSKITDSSLRAIIAVSDQSAKELLDTIQSSGDTVFLLEMSLNQVRDEVCIAAVNSLQDQASLAEVASKSVDRVVTKVALAKLIETTALARVVENAIDPAVRIAAEVRLSRRTLREAFEMATHSNAQKQDLGNTLAAASLLPIQYEIRSYVTQACLTMIRQGDESRIPELLDLLHSYGDKQLCEDYLNCGQPDLDTAGRDWARKYGYSVGTGAGSARARWGRGR